MAAPWKGSIVALVSPMHGDGALDRQSLQGLIDWHVEAGTEALVIAGTTGEAATLTHEENLDIVSWSLEAAAGRIPIIAGTGSNNTAEALHLTREAKRRGAQGCLLVTPYYNKPTQQGLELHYREIASQVDVPIILYNVPHRTGIDMLPETVEKLSKIDNIVAVKEAGSSPERIEDILNRCGDSIVVYGGEDPINLEVMLRGAQGVISVTANVDPARVQQLCLHALAGREAEARAVAERLDILNGALFCQSSPIPTKWALQQLGRIEEGIRLPLVWLAEEFHARVRRALIDSECLPA